MEEYLVRRINRIVNTIVDKFKIDGCDIEILKREVFLKIEKIVSANEITISNFEKKKALIIKFLYNHLIQESSSARKKKRISIAELDCFDVEIERDKFAISEEEIFIWEILIKEKTLDEFKTFKILRERVLKTKEKKAKKEFKKAIIKFLVSILGISESQVPKKVNYQVFVEFGLQRFLWDYFGNSPYKAIKFAYPKTKPVSMQRKPQGFWQQGEKGIKRAKEMLRNVLEEYDANFYPGMVTEEFLMDKGLWGACEVLFNSSIYGYLNASFPRRFYPWEMTPTPKNIFCNKEQVKKAVKWLLKEKLNIEIEKMTVKEIWEKRISSLITKTLFEKNGLRGLLNIYDNSPARIMREVYPNKFLPWDFPTKGKWQGEEGLELAGEATKWVIKNFNNNDKDPDYKFFIENGLRGMITSKSLGFNSSPKAATKNAYKERT